MGTLRFHVSLVVLFGVGQSADGIRFRSSRGKLPNRLKKCTLLGEEWSQLSMSFGVPGDSCASTCLAAARSPSEASLGLDTAFALAFEAGIEEERCLCRARGKKEPLLPPFANTAMCTAEVCWRTYKHLLQVDSHSRFWTADLACTDCFTNKEPSCNYTSSLEHNFIAIDLEAVALPSDLAAMVVKRAAAAGPPVAVAAAMDKPDTDGEADEDGMGTCTGYHPGCAQDDAEKCMWTPGCLWNGRNKFSGICRGGLSCARLQKRICDSLEELEGCKWRPAPMA